MIETVRSSLLSFANKSFSWGLARILKEKAGGKTSASKKTTRSFKGLETPLPQLLAEAQTLVDGLPALQGYSPNKQSHNISGGIHGRRKAGTGDDFWQYRTYSTGDDPKSIDWRRSARGDSLYIRQNEWQTSEDIWFWADPSPSMVYRSDNSLISKSDTAHLVALAAATLFEQGGERLGVLNAQDKPAAGRFGLSRLAEGLDENRQNKNNLNVSLPKIPPRAGTRSSNAHIVLISDFLCEENILLESLRALSNKGVQGHLIHIIDPAEVDFPFSGRTLFEGLEDDGDHLTSRSEDLKDKYQSLISGWINNVQSLAKHAGWSHVVQRTDEPISKSLLHLSEISDRYRGNG